MVSGKVVMGATMVGLLYLAVDNRWSSVGKQLADRDTLSELSQQAVDEVLRDDSEMSDGVGDVGDASQEDSSSTGDAEASEQAPPAVGSAQLKLSISPDPESEPQSPRKQVPPKKNKKNTPPKDAPLRPCKRNEDIYPGKAVFYPGARWKTWVPDRCKFQQFQGAPPRCFEGKKIVWFGDSLLRDVTNKLGSHLESNEVKLSTCEGGEMPWCEGRSRSYKVKNGFFNFYWCPSAAVSGSFNDNKAKRDIRNADQVMIGSAAWDMGLHYRGIRHYYSTMLDRVKGLRARMRKGAELVIFPMHWLMFNACPKTARCHLFNRPRKAQAYREALLMIAACVPGVRVFDTKDLTRFGGKGLTTDGFHYGKMFKLEKDLALANICGDIQYAKPIMKCADAADMMARWLSWPVVSKRIIKEEE